MSYSFWEIVEMAKMKSGDDCGSRPESLKEVLLTFSPDDIRQFNKDYKQKLIDSYKWDLWGAAYLINGGCSDDGFDYFCDFLISEGKEAYEAALHNPDSLSELNDMEDADLEEYRYSIDEAYEELTDEEMPNETIEFPKEPKGQQWVEDDLIKIFPQLAAKYG